MKHLLSTALFSLLIAGIFACTQSDTKSSKSQSIALVADNSPSVSLMDPNTANAAKQRWEVARGSLVNVLKVLNAPQDTAFVARGFHIPLSDLRKILNNIGDTSQLFAMLAIQYDSTSTPLTPYISLIFQAPDTSKARTIRYYDFTRPCPQLCPDVD